MSAEFIAKVAPIIQKYAKQYGYKVASPIIAQCCLESGWGNSGLAKYNNFFGMKTGKGWTGNKVTMKTKEEVNGVLITVDADFRAYSSLDEGIKGYFDFLGYPRYKSLKTAATPEEYLLKIKNAGYATSSKYVANNLALIDKYGLRKYDTVAEIKEVNYYAKITATSLYLRSSYSKESIPLLPKGLPQGMVLKIAAECDGWGRVGDIDGWVSLEYLQKI